MSKNTVTYKQDMPPPGGFSKINYTRVPTWSPRSGTIIAAIALILPVSIWDYQRRKARNIKHLIEDDEARQSLEPLLAAESERLQMWQMRRNRDEENELMKDVPGWVTGTWFGESMFKTNPNLDTWIAPTYPELYAHTRMRDANRHQFNKLYYA